MRNWKLLLLTTIILTGCKKSYDPPVIVAHTSYLVVEGVINTGSDSTIIKLSQTVNLSDRVAVNPLLHAAVSVESDQGGNFPLTETNKGNYVSPGLNLDATHKYRLRISANGKQYLSDFEAALNSPPIDSVNFVVKSNGINLFTNTHDAKNSTRYYRWDYHETWAFHSMYYSAFKSNGDSVILRNVPAEQVYDCWGDEASNVIVLGSSANLSQDIISNNPLTFVASTSEKLGSKYSILVKQYALTGKAYTFWQNLKKSTEQLGSIFDAQPSQLIGNIHAVNNDAEPVIGYVSVGSVASKRIFIENRQLPNWIPTPLFVCKLDTFYYRYKVPGSATIVNQEDQYYNYNKDAKYLLSNPYIPVQAYVVYPPAGPAMVLGHSGSTRECVDCTIRGTNKQPIFWK